MGFWDFFRAKKEETKETEKVKAEELEDWLLARKKKTEKQEEKLLKLIQERINQLIYELEEEAYILKGLNVDERKAEEKIKLIVKENLENYIGHLEKLLDMLNGLKADKRVIQKINSIFQDFEKKSSVSFEKATFLIGKELGNVKESIKNFFKSIEQALKENKAAIEESEIITKASLKAEELGSIKKSRAEIAGRIKILENQKAGLKENIKEEETKIEDIKKSERFINSEKKKEEVNRKRQELEKEENNLREMTDFKSLANFFHSFQKEMSIIKEYKENFKEAFSKNNGEDLLNLIKEAKLPSAAVSHKINSIASLKKEIKEAVIEDTGVEALEQNIKKAEAEIAALDLKKTAEEKADKRLELSFQQTIDSLKAELKGLNIELIN